VGGNKEKGKGEKKESGAPLNRIETRGETNNKTIRKEGFWKS